MNKNDKIYIAGHTGMVGGAIEKELRKQGYNNILSRTHRQLDLRQQEHVEEFFRQEHPDYVFLAAAKVGGIGTNAREPADFLYDNIMIEMNVINSAWKNSCKKLLCLGSSCIYPKITQKPTIESSLLTGELEKTSEAYALAKISGIKYCEYLNRQYEVNFISAMPSSIYGPGDNYNPEYSHVIPAIIKKLHEAKISETPFVTCWGDGSPLREFMYADDLANACLYIMNHYNSPEIINIGTGIEISIKDLVFLIAQIVGYTGIITWDISKPNGERRRVIDNSKLLSIGWKYKTILKDGLKQTYHDFLNRFFK